MNDIKTIVFVPATPHKSSEMFTSFKVGSVDYEFENVYMLGIHAESMGYSDQNLIPGRKKNHLNIMQSIVCLTQLHEFETFVSSIYEKTSTQIRKAEHFVLLKHWLRNLEFSTVMEISLSRYNITPKIVPIPPVYLLKDMNSNLIDVYQHKN